MTAPRGVTVLPGMTATIIATYQRPGTQGKRILVPISAVYKQDTGDQVAWVVGPYEMISRRVVKMGAATGGDVEILGRVAPRRPRGGGRSAIPERRDEGPRSG